MDYTSQQVADMVDGSVMGSGTRLCEAVVIDHRRLPPEGGLFCPLQGTSRDGHDFLADAARAGAAAAFARGDRVDDFLALSISMDLIVVEDVHQALWTLAAAHRRRVKVPVIAITGSAGKTTTRNMLKAVLDAAWGPGCATWGNRNNLLGTPLTLLEWREADTYLLVELGTNAFGEIARLASLVAPHVAVVTCVAAAHLEGFGDLAGVLREKRNLPMALAVDGVALYPSDDALLEADSRTWPGRKVSFGTADGDLVRILEATEGEQAVGVFRVDGRDLTVRLPICGAFNLHNAAGAMGAAVVLGVDPDRAAAALESFTPEKMRMEAVEEGGILFLLDGYNANPTSMKAALDTLCARATGRKVAVLGRMLELGPRADELHREVTRYALAGGADLFIGVGAPAYVRGAPQKGELVRDVRDAREAAHALRTFCKPGDMVLLKGSRGARIEEVLDAFRQGVA